MTTSNLSFCFSVSFSSGFSSTYLLGFKAELLVATHAQKPTLALNSSSRTFPAAICSSIWDAISANKSRPACCAAMAFSLSW